MAVRNQDDIAHAVERVIADRAAVAVRAHVDRGLRNLRLEVVAVRVDAGILRHDAPQKLGVLGHPPANERNVRAVRRENLSRAIVVSSAREALLRPANIRVGAAREELARN